MMNAEGFIVAIRGAQASSSAVMDIVISWEVESIPMSYSLLNGQQTARATPSACTDIFLAFIYDLLP